MDSKKLFEKKTEVYCSQMIESRNMIDYIRKIASMEGKRTVLDFFAENKIKRIIIYGAGLSGKVLFDNIKSETDIEIIGFVDKNKNTEFGIEQFVELKKDTLNQADIIIVTPLKSCEEIKKCIMDLGKYNVMTLAEILNCKRVGQIYEDGVFI